MHAIRHLFLDLEDTVCTPILNGWQHSSLININIHKIRKVIAEFQPHHLHIFSFAIYDAQDVAQFDLHMRPQLEQALGLPVTSVGVLLTDIRQRCCESLSLAPSQVSFSDMVEFWGKQLSFRLFVRSLFSDAPPHTCNQVMLIDDAVLPEEFKFPDIALEGKIVNIIEEL